MFFDSLHILYPGHSSNKGIHPQNINGVTVEQQESPPCLEVCSFSCFVVAVFVQILFLGLRTRLMESHNMRFASLNVDDLSNPATRSRVIAKIKKDKTQVIFYETHVETRK